MFPVRRPLFAPQGVRCSCKDGFDCDQVGKHPRVLWRNGSGSSLTDHAATTDTGIIRRWWAKWPNDNIGIATGAISGLIVVDVDKHKGGWDSVGRLDLEHGWEYDTARVHTPTGGAHFYYRHPGGYIGNSSDAIAPGIDVRGDGGMVLAPPSLHKCGGLYVWQYDLLPGGVRIVRSLA